MRFIGSLLLTTALLTQPALAGDQVLYEEAPDWVDQKQINTADRTEDAPIILIDQQARIESGRLWTYVDSAIALDTPQTLTQAGTLSANVAHSIPRSASASDMANTVICTARG